MAGSNTHVPGLESKNSVSDTDFFYTPIMYTSGFTIIFFVHDCMRMCIPYIVPLNIFPLRLKTHYNPGGAN